MTPLAALLAASLRVIPLTPVEAAEYRLGGEAPWRVVRPVEGPGYRVVLRAASPHILEARVEVAAGALLDAAPFPPEPARMAEAGPLERPAQDPLADALSQSLTSGSRTVLEAIERVILFTSRRIRYAPPTGAEESAATALRQKSGSCVGRSLLAADLLARAGIPARQVTGVLTARRPEDLPQGSRELFSAVLGGVRHRWIEAYVPGLGWVPSDPGGLANAVTSRHLALAGPPEPSLSVATLTTTEAIRWPAIEGFGKGLTLARPRRESGPLLRSVGEGRP